MTRFRSLSLALFMVYCESLIWGPAFAQTQRRPPTIAPETDKNTTCKIAGEVFGTDYFGRSFLVKRDDTGGIEKVSYSKSTIFTELSTRAEAKVEKPMPPANIKIGDRLCVTLKKPSDSFARVIFILTRSEIQREQIEVLTKLHRNSAFGSVVRTDRLARLIELIRIGLDGRTRTIRVDANDPVLIRKYSPDATTIASATLATWSDIRTGDQIYVRGRRSSDGSRIRAALIILGGFRTMVGTILSIDALHECVELMNVRSERVLSIIARPQSLFRISPLLPDAVARTNTMGGQQGWKLHSLEFADLQKGDTVTILFRVGDPPDDLRALAMVTGFGSFGLVSQHEDEQTLWLLDPLNLELP